MTDCWKIRIAGYGTFDFEGTEAEAERRILQPTDNEREWYRQRRRRHFEP